MLNKKSEVNLEIAEACLEMRNEIFYSAGASRAYYAIFQATKYLLVKKCFDYKEFKINNRNAREQRDYAHGSIREALEYYLLKNGFNSEDDLIFIEEMNSTFKKLYYWRLQSDYEETVISKKDLEYAIEKAKLFINKLKKYN